MSAIVLDFGVVFALATLPVIELPGAILVGYWLQLKPVLLTTLSVLGKIVQFLEDENYLLESKHKELKETISSILQPKEGFVKA
ncbi:hypothetical protein L2E82_25191 [Cichorium intybus]|uniref:Uncharacterized protein n=1 Tax=Cichorium intybus TaxID=13427 RepID=A0ACB9E3X1_CICIN|nr:hypothetical protein L2E82_25191 [Cichorium intybus]